jgi:hypothetical protein
MRLAGHGLTIDLPGRWEGTIGRRPADPGAAAVSSGAARTVAPALPQEQLLPVAHLATFPLPADRGDFGSGAVDLMGGGDVFLALVEYGPECAGTALFAPAPRLPGLRAAQFGAARLQRIQKGQAGAQVFCTVAGRAFCVYAVVGAAGQAGALAPEVNAVLAATEVAPR